MAKRILIVDDERSILRSTAMMLEDMGYEVATCGDAAEILGSIESAKPDVVLQDIRMPGLDIEELVRTVRADPRWARLPFVLFTASMDAEEVGARVGAALVLDKPFKPHELLRAIEGALAVNA
ncbi:MAG TPA: response regulator [Candidatus Thermoplasmatota archaeon]|nr:response regulator [Candidatus Thermoplasmatota archaeon]